MNGKFGKTTTNSFAEKVKILAVERKIVGSALLDTNNGSTKIFENNFNKFSKLLFQK